MRIISGVLMTIGVIGILVIIVLAMGYYLFSLPPPVKANMRPVVLTAESAQSFDKKINALEAEIEEAVLKKQNRKISLTITEGEVNSKFVELLAEGKLPLKEIVINFEEDRLIVYTVLNNPGINAKIGIIARMEVAQGNPELVVRDFQLGKLPLPTGVKNGAGTLLNILLRMKTPTGDLSLKIAKIGITKGKLNIEGATSVGG